MIEIKEVGVWLTDLHLHLNNVSQFEKTIDQAVDYCVKNGIKYIFNGGDTFTSRKGQPQEVLKVFRDSLEKLRKAELTMYAITGNHDKTDYSSKDSFLIAFQDHPSLVLIEGYHVLDLSEGLRVHMVSFFEDGMYREILKKGELGKGKNICLTHVGISGAKMNSGISLTSGVNAGDFKMFDKTYVGHYHNFQVLTEDIIYTGSTYPHNFGEDSEKGLWVIKSDGTAHMIETAFTKYVTIVQEEADIEGLLKKNVEGVKLRCKVGKISTMDRARLEQAGVKVEIEHNDLLLLGEKDVLQTFDDQGLVDAYDEWAVKRGIKNKEKGLSLLQQVL